MTTHSTRTSPDDVQRVLDDPRRRVVLDGVHNFRDLGGYPTAGGGTTRWQTVYRADGLGRLTPADVADLRVRGLASVIDLRTDLELTERGRYPVDDHPVSFHHLPVFDKTWDKHDLPDGGSDHDFLMWAYRDMLRVGGVKLATALSIIARADATPLVFHCAAGKDRTGLLAMLLLELVGVPDEYVVADYGKTAEGMERMRVWALAQGPEAAERFAEVPSQFFASPPSVMHELLAELRAEHGSIADYATHLGVTEETIAQLRMRLVDPV